MPGSGARETKLLDRVRTLCLAYPNVNERPSHGAPAFFVRDKRAFLMWRNNHHGDGRIAVWCAAPPGAQDALIAADAERFYRPPYVGHRGWIGMRLDVKRDWKQIAAVIDEAYSTLV